jgi:NAD(P)-dependent dehydrogenase (short-subunit alcohol dehydrogenase family)
MQTLYGRVAVVVAPSDGVGAAIARCFGELGASVVVNYASDKAGAERVVAEIVGSGGRTVAFQSDMANEADFGNALSCARLNFGTASGRAEYRDTPPQPDAGWLCLQSISRIQPAVRFDPYGCQRFLPSGRR